MSTPGGGNAPGGILGMCGHIISGGPPGNIGGAPGNGKPGAGLGIMGKGSGCLSFHAHTCQGLAFVHTRVRLQISTSVLDDGGGGQQK
jgi:hypothetical protein